MTTGAAQAVHDFYDGSAGRIHYRSWSADDPAWVVMVAPGFGDHSGRYVRYGENLAARGGAVFSCDHRGHGHSDGERVLIEDFDDVARDFLEMRNVSSFPSGVPIILGGQSLGGLVVATAARLAEVPVTALAISGARLGRWPLAEDLLKQIDDGTLDPSVGGGGHPLLDPKTELPRDALSRDLAIVEMFKDDPLTYRGVYPLPTLRSYTRAERQLAEAAEGSFELPVLYMHGGADPVTPYRGSVQTLARLVAEDLEVRIFPGARHSIYNELNRDEVFDVLGTFIERVTGGQSA